MKSFNVNSGLKARLLPCQNEHMNFIVSISYYCFFHDFAISNFIAFTFKWPYFTHYVTPSTSGYVVTIIKDLLFYNALLFIRNSWPFQLHFFINTPLSKKKKKNEYFFLIVGTLCLLMQSSLHSSWYLFLLQCNTFLL